MRQTSLDLTEHAMQRQQERNVPHSVAEELRTTAARFTGHIVCGQRVEYRIVRHGRTFWVGVVTPGGVTTFYPHDEQSVLAWARNCLLNPEQSIGRLRRLAGHRTPEERVTDELELLWLGADRRRSVC